MGVEVEPLEWRKFLRWWHTVFEPGQHVAVIAPTGAGKTTMVGGILPLRRFVLCFDPKGGDHTLAATGFPRLHKWPPPKRAYEDMERGIPYRRILGPANPRHDEAAKISDNFGRALDSIYDEKNWTVFLPDLQLLTDRDLGGNHAGKIKRQLIAARDRRVSVITDFQSPSWVPRAAYQQSTWAAVSYTRDRDTIDRLAEILGRPKPEIQGAMAGIPTHGWLIVGRNPREPFRVTRPDPLASGPRVR